MSRWLLDTNTLIGSRLTLAEGDRRIAATSKDGRWGVTILNRPRAVRDLYEETINLARWLNSGKEDTRAVLVTMDPAISRKRLHDEWQGLTDVLRQDIAGRLNLVLLDETEKQPDHQHNWLKALCSALTKAFELESADPKIREESVALPRLTPKSFEVTKVLLQQWLSIGGPLTTKEIQNRVGCSYGTVAAALKRLDSRGELARTKSRRVELASFPRKTWYEILAICGILRKPLYFIDPTSRPSNPEALLSRLKRQAPPGIALGGVEAARRLDPEFDLHGLPRIDVSVHSPDGGVSDLEFITRLDPALKQTTSSSAPVLLAVHPLCRAKAGFVSVGDQQLPDADIVEVLLDLHEMGLGTQAEDLLRRQRAAKK